MDVTAQAVFQKVSIEVLIYYLQQAPTNEYFVCGTQRRKSMEPRQLQALMGTSVGSIGESDSERK